MKEKEKISSLLEEAKRRYPVGTKYKAANDEGNIYTVNAQTFNMLFGDVIQAEKRKGLLYDRGEWAEIVSLPSNNKENKDSVEVKPDNNTLKFEVGKWYKYNNWYIKYDKHYHGGWIASEEINSEGKYSKKQGAFGGTESDDLKILLTDLSEIQQYLPDGHMDKIKKPNSIPEYVECISHQKDDLFLNGKIYKCEIGTTAEEVILVDEFNYKFNHPYNGLIWSFKPSTKEAYEKQQQQQKVEAEPKKIDVKTSITRAIKEDNPQILVDEWGLSAEEICGKLSKGTCYKNIHVTNIPKSCSDQECSECYFSSQYKTIEQCKDWIMKASKNKKQDPYFETKYEITSGSDKIEIKENSSPSVIEWIHSSGGSLAQLYNKYLDLLYPYSKVPAVTNDRFIALSQAMFVNQYANYLQNTLPQEWLSEDNDENDIIEYKPLPPLKEIDVEFISDSE